MAVKKKVTKKKPKKKGLKYWVNKTDKYFHRYIRLVNTDEEGKGNCYTCDTPLEFKRGQCGHFIGREYKSTRWMESNCKLQCSRCNLWGQGKQFEFSLKLGMKLAKKLLARSKRPWVKTEEEYDVLSKYWKEKCEHEESKKVWHNS